MVSLLVLTSVSAEIEQRDMPLSWYQPRNVPSHLVESVARECIPRDWDYGCEDEDEEEGELKAEPYQPSDKVWKRDMASKNRDSGMYHCLHCRS